MIPKDATKHGVDNLRPITVLSILHRLWSGARLPATLFEWQEELLEGVSSRACRPGGGTTDLVVPLAVMAEAARLEDKELYAASYDLSKAFDTMPFDAEGEMVGWRSNTNIMPSHSCFVYYNY